MERHYNLNLNSEKEINTYDTRQLTESNNNTAQKMKENKKKIFDEYEKSMSHYKRIISKTPSKRNNQIERMAFLENSCDRINSHKDISTTSSKRLSQQESNSKSNNIHHSQSISDNKEGKLQNNDNSNINHANNVDAKEDKDKKLQLKYYIAKCFDKLDDNKMIENKDDNAILFAGFPHNSIHLLEDKGRILNAKQNCSTFFHNLNTSEGNSGSPICNINSYLIGIHCGFTKTKDDKTINFGIFFH